MLEPERQSWYKNEKEVRALQEKATPRGLTDTCATIKQDTTKYMDKHSNEGFETFEERVGFQIVQFLAISLLIVVFVNGKRIQLRFPYFKMFVL